jgi:hypothetical protein
MEEKKLQMSLKTKWFEMTKAGIKTEDYREISNYWMTRFIESVTLFGGRYEEFKDRYIKEFGVDNINLLHVNPEVLKRDVKLKKFDVNIMTLGYPKKDDKERILKFEHAGIEIRTGNTDWGAEPDKLYFVIKHGKRIQ